MAVKYLSGSEYQNRADDGREKYIAELFCDSVADIVGKTVINGKHCMFGSVAYTSKEGKLYTLASDGKWYDTDGTEASAT